jgi:SAM-dependent methyltransferase
VSVFSGYARYYDLLYKDKDYVAETIYVDGLLNRYGGEISSILDLGCGSGTHAALLANKGYEVRGIDSSPQMLELASSRLERMSRHADVSFAEGDVRSYRAGRQYDAVVALFHVVSYQTTNTDLLAIFETARHHVRRGGLFVFDCWYGPAVLTIRPAVRTKRCEDAEIEVTRIAQPELHPNENCVDIKFDLHVRNKANGHTEHLCETHRMRYLFMPEVDELLTESEFTRVRAEEWVSGKAPGCDTWSVCFLAQG